MPELFVDGRRKAPSDKTETTGLFKGIGRLKAEWTGSKKAAGMPD